MVNATDADVRPCNGMSGGMMPHHGMAWHTWHGM